ncbi:MAG: 50S ribosomal protein L29 [Chlamydiae bacterium]|nr:50S ribosomal protein L29 [Chlamydiota bacterium]
MIMKIVDIRAQTIEQLEYMVLDLEKELFKLKNELAGSRKLEKPHLIWEKKKQKAQALTILSEKKKK